MKSLATILLLVVFCGCASAEPPDHKPAPTNAVMTVVVPYGAPINGIVGYGANRADTNWTQIIVMPATNGQYMAAHVPLYEEYTATSTNSLTGQESDYAPKVYLNTNNAALPVANVTVTK